MGKRTVFAVLAAPPLNETLAIFCFVSSWVIKLLNFVMSILAVRIITYFLLFLIFLIFLLFRLTQNMTIFYLMWFTSPIALVVIAVTAGKLMKIRR